MLVALLALALPASASSIPASPEPPSIPEEPATTLLGPTYRMVSPVLTGPMKEALADRDWAAFLTASKAVRPVDLRPAERSELHFLQGWAWMHLGTAEKAAGLLEAIDQAITVPRPYVDLVLGEVLLADGKPVDALERLKAVPVDSAIYPRAAVLRAKTLQELNRTKEAGEVFEAIASRPDPSSGNSLALLALALHRGPGSAEAYGPLRRIWASYPMSAEAGRAASLLASYPPKPEHKPTPDEWSLRAEAWMAASRWDDAIDAASNVAVKEGDRSMAVCRALYVKGRSQYKKNALGASIAAFGDVGDRCAGVAPEYGAPSLYLQGTAQFRRKEHVVSAATFAKIPALYPDHSMADDGYLHGGISLQEGGDLPGAQGMWTKALDELPNGDTAPEATWRLAWSLYLEKQPEQARQIAARLGKLPTDVDPVHVDAGRYWAARWAMYPDVDAPTKAVEAGRVQAVTGWRQLLEERPFSFYAILAAARLKEVAPDVLAKLQVRPAERSPLERPWEVRAAFLEHPGVQAGAALARVGLSGDARAEFGRFTDDLRGDEKAWLIELRALSGDWLYAHADFRGWLGEHAVGSHGPGERAVIRVAYPDRYWAEVQAASKPYTRYEPRLFHSLVREESNFNRKIVSFAGARGLSQLMPATATQTAGWLGKKVTMDGLFEPSTNLEIGGKYLDTVLKQFDGSPYCALAGYNAGPGRVNQWTKEWGNPPTDEFVERIPFRETRGYVKRVMGTWQIYRWFIDDGPPFPELSAYNHAMQLDPP